MAALASWLTVKAMSGRVRVAHQWRPRTHSLRKPALLQWRLLLVLDLLGDVLERGDGPTVLHWATW